MQQQNKGKKTQRKKFWRIIICVFFITLILITYFSIKIWWMSKYNRETFNCKDMSYELVPYFHWIGLDAKVIYGNNSESSHAWLSLNGAYFDATTLWFNNEKKYPHINFVDNYPYLYFDEPVSGTNDTVNITFTDEYIYANHTYPVWFNSNRTYDFRLTVDVFGRTINVEAMRIENKKTDKPSDDTYLHET